MATYYVDDAGSATAPYDTWAKAATSLSALDDAVALASADIVYIGHDHVCQYTHAADRTITGPASGLPCVIISATQGSNPPTYQASTTNQIDTTEGAYGLTFNGVFALYGIRCRAGSYIQFNSQIVKAVYAENCTFALGANSFLDPAVVTYSTFVNCVVDLTQDGTTNRFNYVFRSYNGVNRFTGLSFTNAGYRTGTVFTSAAGDIVNTYVSGADFSGFTNATTCEICATGSQGKQEFVDCKTAATWVVSDVLTDIRSEIKFVNCGNGDQPVALQFKTYRGSIVSSSSIYRSTGATVESANTAWLVTTTSGCSKDSPFYSEYIYGRITATGSKTFDLYVTNDTADLNNDEIWLEIEYKADASSGKWTLITDKPADRTTAAAAQTDDVTSTWNGTGPSFTYKQKLSVTATVNTTGQYRARVAVGKASIASSAYLYIDPKVTVS